jgi:hypothetical protein
MDGENMSRFSSVICRHVSELSRYVVPLTFLKRNLVKNGGMLDEVIFVVRTDDADDLKYLDELLPTVPEYKKFEAKGRGGKYKDAWDVVEKGTMYIKIDDDVVRIPAQMHHLRPTLQQTNRALFSNLAFLRRPHDSRPRQTQS